MRYLKIWIPIIALAVMAAGLIGSAERQPPYTLAPESQLPSFLDDDTPLRVKQAYQMAINHHHDLEQYPCYCGCTYMGHMDLADCYIRFTVPAGGIAFDSHAQFCGICVDISQDVMRLMREGRSPTAIRRYIDDTYSQFGPGTHTPLPVAYRGEAHD